MAFQVIKQVKENTDLPVIAKLTPNVTDIVTIALAVQEAKADAISLINTLLGMAIDLDKKTGFSKSGGWFIWSSDKAH